MKWRLTRALRLEPLGWSGERYVLLYTMEDDCARLGKKKSFYAVLFIQSELFFLAGLSFKNFIGFHRPPIPEERLF